MEIIKQYYRLIGIFIGCLILSFIVGFNVCKVNNSNDDTSIGLNMEEKEKEIEGKVTVDIKGAVKKPGVYKLTNKNTINDAIKAAGGLKKSAYTKNINLSKFLSNEMVIYVFSQNEIKAMKKEGTSVNNITSEICKTEVIEVNNCPDITGINNTTTNTTNTSTSVEKGEKNQEQISKLININTASKEELMQISGIGSSKADAIIAYRNENRFKSIEEIKNIKGIGDAVYEKIKSSITV